MDFDGSNDYLAVTSFIQTNHNLTKFIVLDVQNGGNYLCKTDGDSSWESGENIWWLGEGDTFGSGNYPSFVGFGKEYFITNQAIPSEQSLLFFQKNNQAYSSQNYTWASNGQNLGHASNILLYNNNSDTGTSIALGGCPTTYHGNRLYGGGINEVLIFNSFLTDTEITKVNYYLSRKWGLEASMDSDGDGTVDAADSSPLGY